MCFRRELVVQWAIASCLKINEHTLSNEAVSGSEQPAACVKQMYGASCQMSVSAKQIDNNDRGDYSNDLM